MEFAMEAWKRYTVFFRRLKGEHHNVRNIVFLKFLCVNYWLTKKSVQILKNHKILQIVVPDL